MDTYELVVSPSGKESPIKISTNVYKNHAVIIDGITVMFIYLIVMATYTAYTLQDMLRVFEKLHVPDQEDDDDDEDDEGWQDLEDDEEDDASTD